MGVRKGGRSVPARLSSSARSLADVVETLFAEFESTLGIHTVVLVVRRCQRELDISGPTPRSGLLESRARQRLQALATIRRTDDRPTDDN